MYSIINYDDGATVPIRLYEFDPSLGITDVSSTVTINTITGIDKTFTMVDVPTRTGENYYMICIWGSVYEVVRVGNPEVALIAYYDDQTNKLINYGQYDLSGNQLASGILAEIDPVVAPGLYFVKLGVLTKGFYELYDQDKPNVPAVISISIPYKTLSSSTGGGGSSGNATIPKLFMDTQYRYGTFGFMGNRFSRFDPSTGWYMDVSGQVDADGKPLEVRASDFMKVFCTYNNIPYDRTQPDNITNYILQVKAFNENTGAFLSFVPGVTPETSPANFNMFSIDEYGNVFVRGLQVLYTGVPITTTPTGEQGLIFPFTNEAKDT